MHFNFKNTRLLRKYLFSDSQECAFFVQTNKKGVLSKKKKNSFTLSRIKTRSTTIAFVVFLENKTFWMFYN